MTDPGNADDELKELRAKRAALADARAARELQQAAEAELATARQDLADDQALEAAEIEHGPLGKQLVVVKTDLGAIILKRPRHAAYKRFQDEGKSNHDDVERLVRPCVVHPSLAAFDRIMEVLPATMQRCGLAVAKLAGHRMEEVAAK